ncbi:hypothetical protein K474DRAFT_1680373 [Panus rudis PR-1116 ss-1]|nr:hypothetical protein K474DRAFT_1680373 [Panus rudis PR-1116 ss-1]
MELIVENSVKWAALREQMRQAELELKIARLESQAKHEQDDADRELHKYEDLCAKLEAELKERNDRLASLSSKVDKIEHRAHKLEWAAEIAKGHVPQALLDSHNQSVDKPHKHKRTSSKAHSHT